AHGFRKFAMKQFVNSKINPEIREMLLGHKIALASCYYRPTDEELYAEYEKAVNNLIINEENRLKIKVNQLTERQDEIELMKYKHEKDMIKLKEQITKDIKKEVTELLTRIKPEIIKEAFTERFLDGD